VVGTEALGGRSRGRRAAIAWRCLAVSRTQRIGPAARRGGLNVPALPAIGDPLERPAPSDPVGTSRAAQPALTLQKE